jgi:hypothetical protein
MLRRFAIINIATFLFSLMLMSSCASRKGNTVTVVKPRTHKTWYSKHTYKRKWHIGRLRFYPEKQGVKKVKMRG